MEGNGKQLPAMISQEGPLRSITVPPFTGPVAFTDSGPLASAATSTTFPLRDGGTSAASLHHNPTSKGAQVSAPYAPPTPVSRAPTRYSPGDTSFHQPQRPAAATPPSAANTPVPADVFSQDLGFEHPFQRTAPAPAEVPVAQNLFSRPPQPPPPDSDPLSHLLRDGMKMLPAKECSRGAQEATVRGSNSPFAERSSTQHTQMQERPPSNPHSPSWSPSPPSGVSGNRDGTREKVVPASPSPRGPPAYSQPQGMPALPPPPQGYTGYSQGSSTNLEHQPQKRSVVSTPPTAPVTPFNPPHKESTLAELASEFLTSSTPTPPEPRDQNSAMEDPQGWVAALGRLARRRAWVTLVDAAGTMLVVHRGGGAPSLTVEQAMDVRLRRALGLLRLGRGEEAVEAATEAGEEGRQLPLAPVSVASRLAAAGAKATCGSHFEADAVDELNVLKLELEGIIAADPALPPDVCRSGHVMTAAKAKVWRRRVMSCLANTFVTRGDWRLALSLLEEMGEDCCAPADKTDPQSGAGEASAEGSHGEKGEVGEDSESMVSACRVELLSRIGRVFLQFGALKDAEVYFRRAEEAVVTGNGEDCQAVADNARILINRGLLLFSKNDFVSAQENFEKAAVAAAAKQGLHKECDDYWAWAASDENMGLLGSAMNNLSLAMVYSCDVMRGVRTLEGLIRKNPVLYMLDVVVFNLCTLYDLSYDPIASALKKRTLQAVADRFLLEDINPGSFRTN